MLNARGVCSGNVNQKWSVKVGSSRPHAQSSLSLHLHCLYFSFWKHWSLPSAHNDETDRQTDKQMNRQTDRHTDRQTDRQTERQTDRQTDRQAKRQTHRHTHRHHLPTALQWYLLEDLTPLFWANLINLAKQIWPWFRSFRAFIIEISVGVTISGVI